MTTNFPIFTEDIYVDDTFALVSDLTAATDFLSVLNNANPAIQSTMQTAVNNS